MLRDQQILRRGTEPKDFWSQSLWQAHVDLPHSTANKVRVRFFNDGGKRYMRAEGHLMYPVTSGSTTTITYDWTDDSGEHRQSRELAHSESWHLPTGTNVKTRWVELAAE